MLVVAFFSHTVTRFFLNICCLYMMTVFTTSMTGTQAKAKMTKKIWRPFCKTKIDKVLRLKENKKKNASSSIAQHKTDLPRVQRPDVVRVFEEEHVDEADKEAGCQPGVASVICHPLVEDQDDQVAKEASHEDDLRDEAEVDI